MADEHNVPLVLDGRRAPTPVDDVEPLAIAASPKVHVDAKVFIAVAGNLRDPKVRARFMVIASLASGRQN